MKVNGSDLSNFSVQSKSAWDTNASVFEEICDLYVLFVFHFAVQFLFLLALFLFTERVKMTTSQFPWEPICFSALIKQSIVQQNQLLFHNQNNTLATFVKANPVILPFTQKSIDANFTVSVGFGHSLSVYLQFKLAIYFARCQENKTR